MFKFISNFFKRNESEVNIKPEQLWILSDGSPWGCSVNGKLAIVKILDVKNGWVKYYVNERFNDERCEIKIFCKIYTLYKDIEPEE